MGTREYIKSHERRNMDRHRQEGGEERIRRKTRGRKMRRRKRRAGTRGGEGRGAKRRGEVRTGMYWRGGDRR